MHLSAIGCPILGDPTYGGKKVGAVRDVVIPRVMLHAKVLGFLHPVSQEPMKFVAPLPADMTEVVSQLRRLPSLIFHIKREIGREPAPDSIRGPG